MFYVQTTKAIWTFQSSWQGFRFSFGLLQRGNCFGIRFLAGICAARDMCPLIEKIHMQPSNHYKLRPLASRAERRCLSFLKGEPAVTAPLSHSRAAGLCWQPDPMRNWCRSPFGGHDRFFRRRPTIFVEVPSKSSSENPYPQQMYQFRSWRTAFTTKC